jgi:hypothetical protein
MEDVVSFTSKPTGVTNSHGSALTWPSRTSLTHGSVMVRFLSDAAVRAFRIAYSLMGLKDSFRHWAFLRNVAAFAKGWRREWAECGGAAGEQTAWLRW